MTHVASLDSVECTGQHLFREYSFVPIALFQWEGTRRALFAAAEVDDGGCVSQFRLAT